MPVQFGTVEFFEAMAQQLDADPEWKRVGNNLSYAMVYRYDSPMNKDFFMTFDEGRIVETREALEGDLTKADFVISGAPETWRGIFDKKINPTAAIMKGQIKVKGKMTVLLKNMSAFNYIVEAMTKIEFE